MVKYKIEYELKGGAGAPIIFSTGTKMLTMSSFTKLTKLHEILGKDGYKYMSKIRFLIEKYNTKISDFNSKYIINVTDKELGVLQYIEKNLL
tara:strand:+ start:856 stop:1131 length:276 start_codon:yes stop_codon:yes gene_type:complete